VAAVGSRVDRRSVLALAGTAVVTAVAGCSDSGPSEPTKTADPAPSELRLSVTNDAETAHDVRFVLRITRSQSTTVEAFELTGIEPGESRRRDPQELPAGDYELEMELSEPLSLSSVSRWTGRTCPVKSIELELRENGLRKRDACPDDPSGQATARREPGG